MTGAGIPTPTPGPVSPTRSAGCFVSFEGIDGAGKSTHIAAVADWLRARGAVVAQTREPGGTPLAEAIRALVLHQPMDALTESLLVFAARRDHLLRCIEPALARGEVVLCDRFTDASFAYQGGGRGLDMGFIAELERVAVGIKPELTFLLDVGVAQGLERARARGGEPDRIEREQRDFFERVRSTYLARARAEPGRFRVIDASQPAAAVQAAVTASLAEWLEKSR